MLDAMHTHSEPRWLQRLRTVVRLWLVLCIGFFLGCMFGYYWLFDGAVGKGQLTILFTVGSMFAILPMLIPDIITSFMNLRRNLRGGVGKHNDDV